MVITVDGRRHEVVVQPPEADGTVEVAVGGEVRRVSRTAGGDALVRHAEGGAQIRVTVPSGPAPQWAAAQGQTHALVVRTARQAARDEAQAADGPTDGSATIEAPMPGRVVKVVVEEGQRVEAEDTIVIVEAMKMENEVRTPVAGRVTGLCVEAGATVEPGQLMCAIEADPE